MFYGPVVIRRLSAWKPASVAFDGEQGDVFYFAVPHGKQP